MSALLFISFEVLLSQCISLKLYALCLQWFVSCRLRTFSTPFHNSNPKGGSVLKQRSDLNFNNATIFMMTNVNVQDWPNFRIPTNPVSGSRSRIVTRHRSVLLVLFRQFSNQRWSIVWITSGRQIVVRIAARILATGFAVAVHRYEGRQLEVQ